MRSKFILSHQFFSLNVKANHRKKSNWSASQKYIHAKIKKFEFPIYNISREGNCKQLSLPKTTAAYQKILIFHISSFESHHLQWQTAEYDWVRESEAYCVHTQLLMISSTHAEIFFDDFSHDYVYITPIDVVVIIGWVMSTWTSLTFYCHTHVCMSWQEVKIIKILNNLTLAIPW